MMSRDRAFIFIGQLYCEGMVEGNLRKVDPENRGLIMQTMQYMGNGCLLL